MAKLAHLWRSDDEIKSRKERPTASQSSAIHSGKRDLSIIVQPQCRMQQRPYSSCGTPLVTDSEEVEQAMCGAFDGCCNHTSVNKLSASHANTWKLTQGRMPMYKLKSTIGLNPLKRRRCTTTPIPKGKSGEAKVGATNEEAKW